jgi:hypothetical protein
VPEAGPDGTTAKLSSKQLTTDLKKVFAFVLCAIMALVKMRPKSVNAAMGSFSFCIFFFFFCLYRKQQPLTQPLTQLPDLENQVEMRPLLRMHSS